MRPSATSLPPAYSYLFDESRSAAGQFAKIACLQQRLVDQAAPDSQRNSAAANEVGCVSQVDTPNRDDPYLWQRSQDCFDQPRPSQVGREQLDQVGSSLPGGEHFGRGEASGHNRDAVAVAQRNQTEIDRKSTRLNSSHQLIS